MRSRSRFVVAVCVLGLLAGCGRGGSFAPPVPQVRQVQAATGQGLQPIAVDPLAGPSYTLQFPSAGGYGGSLSMSATDAAALTLHASTTAPAGAGLTSAVLYALTIVPATTIAFDSTPSVRLSLPANVSSAGKQFYYALVPPPGGGSPNIRIEGPGNAAGRSAEFDATLTPLTLVTGQTYTFVFFALTGCRLLPQLLYVANAGKNSITVYALPAAGNAMPVRTIAGSRTGLSDPVSLAVDADGNVAVVNDTDPSTAVVDIFASGANGNVSPMRRFSTPNTSSGSGNTGAIALDPYDASISLALQTDLSRISTFRPTGSLVRTLPSAQGVFNTAAFRPRLSPAAQFIGLGIDASDRLLVGYNFEDRFNSAGVVAMFAAHASGTQGPIVLNVAQYGQFVEGFAYSRAANAFTALTYAGIAEYADGPASPIVRQFGWPPTFSDAIAGAAVDRSGNVFIGDTTADAILLFRPSGAASFAAAGKIGGPNTGLAAVTDMTVGSR